MSMDNISWWGYPIKCFQLHAWHVHHMIKGTLNAYP